MAWWMMQCDDNHVWWRLVEGEGEPPEELLACPEDGAEAVVASRHEMADRVAVTIVPAAWEHEGTVGFRDKFFLEIASVKPGGPRLRSVRLYSWDDAIKKMSWFKDIDWEAAERRWQRGDFTKPSEDMPGL